MNDIKLLKKQLTKYKRKYNAELQANKSLIDANTTLVDKDRLLMFDIKKLDEENKQIKSILNELENILIKQIEEDKDTQNNKILFMRQEDKHILNTIKELKESDKQ